MIDAEVEMTLTEVEAREEEYPPVEDEVEVEVEAEAEAEAEDDADADAAAAAAAAEAESEADVEVEGGGAETEVSSAASGADAGGDSASASASAPSAVPSSPSAAEGSVSAASSKSSFKRGPAAHGALGVMRGDDSSTMRGDDSSTVRSHPTTVVHRGPLVQTSSSVSSASAKAFDRYSADRYNNAHDEGDRYGAYAEERDEEVTLESHSDSLGSDYRAVSTLLGGKGKSMDTAEARAAIFEALRVIDHYADRYGVTRKEILVASQWASMRRKASTDASSRSGTGRSGRSSVSGRSGRSGGQYRTKLEQVPSGVELSVAHSSSTVSSGDENDTEEESGFRSTGVTSEAALASRLSDIDFSSIRYDDCSAALIAAQNYDCTRQGFETGFDLLADAADAQRGKEGVVDKLDEAISRVDVAVERMLGAEPFFLEKLLEEKFTCNDGAGDVESHTTASTAEMTTKSSGGSTVGTSNRVKGNDYAIEDYTIGDEEYTIVSIDDDLSTVKEVLGIKHLHINQELIRAREQLHQLPQLQCLTLPQHTYKDVKCVTIPKALNCLTPARATTDDDDDDAEDSKPVIIRDVDFDQAPTQLYRHIQAQEWTECVSRCETHPIEAHTWVYRRDPNPETGTSVIRWRLLPIHAACIFHAPPSVINALLESHTDSALMKDDQSKLPLHIACHAGCDGDVLIALLNAYPDAVDIRDKKGRLPVDVAQSSRAENKASVVEVIKDFCIRRETDKRKREKARREKLEQERKEEEREKNRQQRNEKGRNRFGSKRLSRKKDGDKGRRRKNDKDSSACFDDKTLHASGGKRITT